MIKPPAGERLELRLSDLRFSYNYHCATLALDTMISLL